MKIRTLRPGEPVPTTPPRRYHTTDGYIRLRWKLGVGRYVETLEHRVVDGQVTTAEHVHHKNRIRDDNRPENLEYLDSQSHSTRHRSVDRAEVVRRYESGQSIVDLSLSMGRDTGALSRILRAEGVQMRTTSDYAARVDPDALRSECAKSGVRVPQVAEALGLTEAQVRRLMRVHGVPSFPAGNPSHLRASA